MPTRTPDLWALVQGRPEIDPHELAGAINREARRPELDYRTRLLIHDGLLALREYWGSDQFGRRLAQSSEAARLAEIAEARFEGEGFPSLGERLVEQTSPDTIEQYLRELGGALPTSVQLDIGGSVALILQGQLSRHTEDIDIVDEVPAEVRTRHALLAELRMRYGLMITHFQSHYLPQGWQNRLHRLGDFGKLKVRTVDLYDIFLCKLFSRRTKDRDDLRLLAPQLDKERLVRLLTDTTTSLRQDDVLRQQAEQNWYILFGEQLPA